MKRTIASLLCIPSLLGGCNNSQPSNTSGKDSPATDTSSVDPSKDWKPGVALWTLHTVNFPQSLEKVDSTGLKYIEPNTFHTAGPELKDSTISKLSPAGIAKLKILIAQKGFVCESICIVGDSTVSSWKKQFDIARQLGVKYVTTEPPLNMWDSIDSLAGAYGLKVAIHEH